MTDEPFVCLTRIRDGRASYIILLDDRYWNANDWEMKMIMEEGHHPEDLGMAGWTDEDLAQDE